MSCLITENREGVWVITLNRPEKYNSVNAEMADAFREALDQAGRDPEIRTVYIQGAGKAFCAGQDLSEALDADGPAMRNLVIRQYNPLILRIRNLEKPVVAAVGGVAAGAGANLALAADIVLASESASFLQAFSKIGLIPDSGGSFFLPRLVGLQRATALTMLGDKIPASEAKAMGLIYEVFPDQSFVDQSMAIALKLAKMPTRALALTKKLLNQSFDQSLEAQLEAEADHQALAGETDDYKEGVKAFLEKRPPQFRGT